MKVRKVRNLPDCPVCGKNTSKSHRSNRRGPFCTMKCAAEYGQRVFRNDPRCWDVWYHKWFHKDSFEGKVKFTNQEFYTTAVTAIWRKNE
jgi:hypothetical protein